MRGSKWWLLTAVIGALPACEQVDGWRTARGEAGRLVLSLEAPEMLDWGGTGTIRMSLQNQGSAAVDGATIEVHLPAWLEFGSVEPAGTEVVVLGESDGTRLSYRMAAPLEPGEQKDIVQHVRVPDAGMTPVAGAMVSDTAAPLRPVPPTDRVMRARLLTADGEVTGVEVQAVLAFRGVDDGPLVPQPATARDGMLTGEGVAGVRLGMSAEALHSAVPSARDTTIVTASGGRERAMLLSLDGNRSAIALLGERGVESIVTRDAGFVTERGLGVGSRLGELRSAYGRECVEPHGSGQAAVRFPAAPGLAFALAAALPDSARLAANAAALPDSARVTEVWVRTRRDGC